MAMYQPPRDMKSLTFCSIYKESYNIILSNAKLFAQISIFLILPLSLITSRPSSLFYSLIFPDTFNFNPNNPPQNPSYETLSPTFTSSWEFALYKFVNAVFSTALTLVYFTSVTYAVACICTDHSNITFQSTLRAFWRAWKKLVLTKLAAFSAIMGYTFLMGLLMTASWAFTSDESYLTLRFLSIQIILVLLYIGGLVYMGIVWLFGGAVAVLESAYGFEALSKSKSLIKGKVIWTYSVLLVVNVCNYLVLWTMMFKVVGNGRPIGLGTGMRVGLGVVCLPMMVVLTLFGAVVQTVAYLVCKADKGESVTKSSVMDHLEMFVIGFAYDSLVKDEQI